MAFEVRVIKCLLRDRRLSAGLTQEQLAEIIGVQKSRISEYENGKRNMSVITAKKIAVACGCGIEDLYVFDIIRV